MAATWSVRARWALLSLGAAVLAGWLTGASLRHHHRAGYRGVCGPHATDSAARACTREEHDREFGAGIAGVSLLSAQGTAALLVALAVDAIRRARSSRERLAERAT